MFFKIRALWFMLMSLSRSEQVQKLGIVHLGHLLDGYPEKGVDYEFLRIGSFCVASCLPLRISAIYITYNNNAWANMLDFAQLIMGPILRVRARMLRGELNA